MLAERVGRSRAEHICLAGQSVSAKDGLAMGLVDEMVDDPGAAAVEYATKLLLPKSASSLRIAVKAIRGDFGERFRQSLAEVERLFLEELMATEDANEGLRAFLEKRDPAWTDE
jgi:cyclohexa-1,5-dienecarbonyl-CoA hydratase